MKIDGRFYFNDAVSGNARSGVQRKVSMEIIREKNSSGRGLIKYSSYRNGHEGGFVTPVWETDLPSLSFP